jgi:polysaccharide biosynthesis protein PslH
MRILLVAPMPPSATAMLAAPRILNAALVGLGERHEVTLAVVAGPEEHELEAVARLKAKGVDLHPVCRSEPRSFSERWGRRDRLGRGWIASRNPWRTVWYRDARLQQVVDRLLAERSFDVVAVEDNAAAAYRFGNSVPVVFAEHEVRSPRPMRMPSGPPRAWARAALGELDWRRWPRYQRSTWNQFDLIQAFTGRDAEAIRRIAPELGERVRVNPFGLQLPDPLPPSPADSAELLFSGNFTHPPNVDAALWLGTEIMPRVRAQGPSARLRIVGPWPPPSVVGLACADIEVTGGVPDIRPLFASAAAVLAPVRIGGGMRMKVLEALALGRAVITTTRGAEGLGPSSPAPFIVADTADQIADAVAGLLADPEARAAIGERARTYASEHHSPSAYARRLEAVYEEAIELAPARRR